MDEATERRIVELRKRISEILDRRDGSEGESCLAFDVLIQFVWSDRPYEPIPLPEDRSLTVEEIQELVENDFRQWGDEFAPLDLPFPGTEGQQRCEVRFVIEKDTLVEQDVFDLEKGKLVPSNRVDDVESRKREFFILFGAIAAIVPFADFGGSFEERLLSYLIKRIDETDRWEPTPRQDCHVAVIQAYPELDRLLEGMIWKARQASNEPRPVISQSIDHSPDFCTVNWGNKRFQLNLRQAACFCVMLENYRKGTPFLSQDYILMNAQDKYREMMGLKPDSSALDSLTTLGDVPRLRDVFRTTQKKRNIDHPAWMLMIVKAGKNSFGLAAPAGQDSQETPA